MPRLKQYNGNHIYQGNCPDNIDPYARDPNCKVCQALTFYEEFMKHYYDEYYKEGSIMVNYKRKDQ